MTTSRCRSPRPTAIGWVLGQEPPPSVGRSRGRPCSGVQASRKPLARRPGSRCGQSRAHGLEIVMAVAQGFEVQREQVGKRIIARIALPDDPNGDVTGAGPRCRCGCHRRSAPTPWRHCGRPGARAGQRGVAARSALPGAKATQAPRGSVRASRASVRTAEAWDSTSRVTKLPSGRPRWRGGARRSARWSRIRACPCTAAVGTRSSAPPTAITTWSCSSKAPASADPEAILDDPRWVRWRGGPAHEMTSDRPRVRRRLVPEEGPFENPRPNAGRLCVARPRRCEEGARHIAALRRGNVAGRQRAALNYG